MFDNRTDDKTGGKTVVPLLMNTSGTDDDTGIADFIRYWRNLPRTDGVPRRSDVDPRGISKLISNAFIAERVAPGLARLRIAGTHLSDLLGMEVRGMPISALIAPGHRDLLADQLVRVFDEPAMLRLSLTTPGKQLNANTLGGTMLLMPLRSDLGDVSRALGCLVTHGPMGVAPHRFEISNLAVTPLSSQRMRADAPTDTSPAETSPKVGFADEQAGFEHAENPLSAERPYLKLVR